MIKYDFCLELCLNGLRELAKQHYDPNQSEYSISTDLDQWEVSTLRLLLRVQWCGRLCYRLLSPQLWRLKHHKRQPLTPADISHPALTANNTNEISSSHFITIWNNTNEISISRFKTLKTQRCGWIRSLIVKFKKNIFRIYYFYLLRIFFAKRMIARCWDGVY